MTRRTTDSIGIALAVSAFTLVTSGLAVIGTKKKKYAIIALTAIAAVEAAAGAVLMSRKYVKKLVKAKFGFFEKTLESDAEKESPVLRNNRVRFDIPKDEDATEHDFT